jgi:hypothetical protein
MLSSLRIVKYNMSRGKSIWQEKLEAIVQLVAWKKGQALIKAASFVTQMGETPVLIKRLARLERANNSICPVIYRLIHLFCL